MAFGTATFIRFVNVNVMCELTESYGISGHFMTS